MEKLLSNHEPRFISWRIYAPLEVFLLTEIEEEYGINNIMQDEPKMSDEQRTVLVTNNSGLNFLSVPTKVTGGEVIEILNDDEEDVLNEYIRN